MSDQTNLFEAPRVQRFPPPRPFQEVAHRELRAGFVAGHFRQVLMAPTGAGKSYIGLRLCAEAIARGKRVVFVCDRKTLINQTSAVADSYGMPLHGVFQADHKKFAPQRPFQIASAQTIAARGLNDTFDVVIVDECFVAGTKVATPRGNVPIERVRCGDAVYTATGLGIVESAIVKSALATIRLEFSDGSVTECTEDHPLFTRDGWVKAGAVEIGSLLVGVEGLRALWQNVWAEDLDQHQDGRARGRLGRRGLAAADLLLEVLRKEAQEPDEQSPDAPASGRDSQANQTSTHQARRERAIAALASVGAASCVGRRVGGRARREDELAAGLSAFLQPGSRRAGDEDVRGNRRREPRDIRKAGTGQKEDGLFGFSRLVGVSRIERKSPVPVFNLRVSGHPSYFADGRLVHNCHTVYEPVKALVMETKAAVIGLSATPFTKGLGLIYTRVINAATMRELTEQKILAPLRVLSCKRIDMKGAKTNSKGEWSDKAAEERGLAIVGDVVREWVTHAEDRKTIVFGPTVVHCEELVRQFIAAGVNARTFCGTTPDNERAELLAEYRKPDSKIRVLVSVEALAKGFDVPDVGCVVDCRPLRKSLSTFVQMIGRGLRGSPGKDECVARGSLVLTDKGEVPIERVTLDHKVWDGVAFVDHSGAVCRGVRAVVEHDGVVATPEHEVMTDDGWQRIEEASRRQLRIARTGVDGRPVRFADDHLARGGGLGLGTEGRGGVREVFEATPRKVSQHPEATGHRGVPSLQSTSPGNGSAVALLEVPGTTAEVSQPQQRVVPEIRSPGDSVPLRVGERSGDMGGGESRGAESLGRVGSNQQRWALRTGQSSLGDATGEREQPTEDRSTVSVRRVPQEAPAGAVRGPDAPSVDFAWPVGRGARAAMEPPVVQAEREVWDVLSAGPLQRFTCNGRLVHNCLLLDHSGNVVRFAEDFSDIYFNGLTELDAGERLDKTVREDEGPVAGKPCPSCGNTPMGKRCTRCGFEPVRVSSVEHQSGKAEELDLFLHVKKYAPNLRELFNAIATHKRATAKPGGNPKGATAHAYRDITGNWPPRSFDFDTAPSAVVSPALVGKLKSMSIAYARSRRST